MKSKFHTGKLEGQQIISLGAGFDTSYFHLQEKSPRCETKVRGDRLSPPDQEEDAVVKETGSVRTQGFGLRPFKVGRPDGRTSCVSLLNIE